MIPIDKLSGNHKFIYWYQCYSVQYFIYYFYYMFINGIIVSNFYILVDWTTFILFYFILFKCFQALIPIDKLSGIHKFIYCDQCYSVQYFIYYFYYLFINGILVSNFYILIDWTTFILFKCFQALIPIDKLSGIHKFIYWSQCYSVQYFIYYFHYLFINGIPASNFYIFVDWTTFILFKCFPALMPIDKLSGIHKFIYWYQCYSVSYLTYYDLFINYIFVDYFCLSAFQHWCQ